MRRRKYEYQKLGDTSVKCYNAYNSYFGKIIEGVLKGGLAVIVSAMSTEDVGDEKMASTKMLDFHAALGSIWFALIAKDYLEAGNIHFKEIRQDLADLGVEIATYAKLKSQTSEVNQAWAEPAQASYEDQVNDEVFIGVVNSKIMPVINAVLRANNMKQISLPENITAEEFEQLVAENVKYSKTLPTLMIGAAGLGATIAGAAAIASANPAALVGGIATAAVGGMAASVAGATLAADASKLKKLSRDLLKGITNLNEKEFSVEQIAQAKEAVIGERREIPNALNMSQFSLTGVVSNPASSSVVAPSDEHTL